MAAIEVLRVDAVEMAHQPRQVGLAGVQHQAEVIDHQTVSQQLRVEAGHGLIDNVQVQAPVIVTAVDRLTAVSTRGDVVGRVGKFDAKGASHEARFF